MNYEQTIDYLYSRLPMFTRIGAAAYKKDLHNTVHLLDAIGNPQHRFRSIHIAGTNGKGSCSHMLASILHQAGYKTGLYTSPHLYDFRERIKISGQKVLDMVPKDFVTAFTQKIKPEIEKIEPSFFEVTVAMAFDFFAQEQVDIAIIETGLGGRLDSTNVLKPELSIITNIGWDHMNLLGDTLDKIAFEKAGIIKPDIPVVIGETLEETLPVFLKMAAKSNAPVLLAEKTWIATQAESSMEMLHLKMESLQTREVLWIACDLPGIYQKKNIATVLTAVDILRNQGWQISRNDVLSGLKNVKSQTGLWGRWQVVDKNPYVVLDVAHNEAGMTQLIRQLNQMQLAGSFNKVHLILGMVKDKEADKVLQLLPPSYRYYFTQAQTERALPAETLRIQAQAFQLTGEAYAKPELALAAARIAAAPDDFIVVCGSIFVVAEIERLVG